MSEIYNANYYHSGCGPIPYEEPEHWVEFFGKIAQRIVDDFHPQTVLDAGCAMGYLVAALRDRGVEAYGVDISNYAISKVREDVRPYCVVCSLTEQLPESLPKRYDLVITIEVLEHLYEEDGKKAIQNLCSYSDCVIFSSTPDDFTEPTHVNVQQREYWAKQFAERKFFDDLSYRPIYLTPYAVCYRKSENLVRIVENYERNLRQSEATHAQSILEWRGAVNDKETIIQEGNAQLQEVKRTLNERDAYCQEKEEQLNRLYDEKEALENENTRLTQRLSAAQADIHIKQEENARLEKRLLGAQADINAKQNENVRLVRQLSALNEERNSFSVKITELQRQLTESCTAYNIISNAFFWKATRPLRCIVDFMKRCLQKNQMAHLVWKGMKSMHQNGFRYTWNRVRTRKFHQREMSEVLTRQESLDLEEIPQDMKFSILVPLYNTPEKYLVEMIDSVKKQSYSNWELCLYDASDEQHDIAAICCGFCESDPRIRYKKAEQNGGISENTNHCAEMATGDYLGLLDHDDVLMPYALMENAKAILKTQADVLYSDEDHLSLQGTHVNPFYKPDWSPDLLYSQMYICHFLVFRRSLFEEIGGFRKEFDGSQDYDLMLRFSEVTQRICHIPIVLYSWRESEGSTAANADAKPYAHTAGFHALNAHLKRKYPGAHAEETEYTFVFAPRFNLSSKPLVSIIIPMKDHWKMSDACIRSIFEKSTYRNFEILVLDNGSKEAASKTWMERIQKEQPSVHVLNADMEFNWSKLNNFGIAHAKGDVLVFLNNDTLIISEDWMERLAENALRPDVGVVGGLLLYPDNTIQHAGVVVGIGGWADHIFKGMPPVHYGSPFVSPVISRNVLAVTGACMAVSRATLEKIGLFDEEFIICGSDVELGIRAHDAGLLNRYDAKVRLYHLESKSRDSYIPKIDFEKSYEAYEPYRENIDPYFNINLDIKSVVPKEKAASMSLVNFKNYLKQCSLTSKVYQAAKKTLMPSQNYAIPEIEPLEARKGMPTTFKLRLNLLIPSVDQKHVFGGISTAIRFFEELAKQDDYAVRMIVMDAPVVSKTSVLSADYMITDCNRDEDIKKQVISMANRHGKTIPVTDRDRFVATGWWTAYVISDVLRWQNQIYGRQDRPLIYMIQDYEPGFYPWSSRYMMAEGTYRLEFSTYAVINSRLLADYLSQNGYTFAKAWSFTPKLSSALKTLLPPVGSVLKKKKQILIYGRPSTARNAFELLVYALKIWRKEMEHPEEWTVLSAGELHDDVSIGDNMVLHSVGKLTLEEYASMMLDTYAGVSLMVSPHPSYPPLEMASFGIKTITNRYGNKNLSDFSDNMVSLNTCSPREIALTLTQLCRSYDGTGLVTDQPGYLSDGPEFGTIPEELSEELV